MSKIEKALSLLHSIEAGSRKDAIYQSLHAGSKLIVTFLFLFTMLSIPVLNIVNLIPFFLYPIVLSSLAEITYANVFKRSLIVLPFVLFIAVFNPVFDREVVFKIGNLGVTDGWISFFSIIFRGLLSVQALMILVYGTGVNNIAKSLQNVGVPNVFITQLLLLYRYLFVLLQETMSMKRACDSRNYGRESFPVKFWGNFIAQLLIRTIDRSDRIHKAMLSRGFDGLIPTFARKNMKWVRRDYIFLVSQCVIIFGLRYSFILFRNI